MGNAALQSLSDHLLGCGAGFGFNTFALGGVGGSHLQHLAAASSAGTSLEANLKHITVTLATWDAVWEVYLDPKWARQRLRLYGAQDRALEQYFKKLQLHGRVRQLMVFFDAAGTGNGGRWSADAVLRARCKVVCPRHPRHRTSRVSSPVNGQQPSWSQQRDQPVRDMMWCPVVAPRKPPQAPCSSQAATQPAASEPGPSTPLPAERSKCTKAEQVVEPTQPTKGQEKGKGKGKAAKAKRAPQPGRWLIRDCNAALNMQHIGECSMTVQSDEADSDSEDEEEAGSRQAAADMATTFGENEEEGNELGSEPVQLYAIPPKGRRAALVPASDFQQHVDSAKRELAATADAVVRDLHSRFLPPEHAKGLAVVYAHYWDKQPSDEDFLERLAIVKARYCMDATLADAKAQQCPAISICPTISICGNHAEHRVELSSAAANPAKETTKLWHYLAGQPITKADILEYIKLAELALVMTPGLVEEERIFSAMAYLKDDTRNRLQECHLNVCARVFSSNQFDLDTFPDERAISKWLDNAAVRGRYRL
ncbi:hypothetical protein QJQ45_011312 [Haematococcus lacustris]|nr:hypothetical protein QJQ45_011312 [Haematococcus lacustris]